jgi:DNA mismatch endonuclease, patch repair protein
MRKDISYAGRAPASEAASRRARSASAKSRTRPEEALYLALRALKLRFRRNDGRLPGVPDFVFASARLVVFVDGDFWHGRNWPARRIRIAGGHNADYWIAKIERNMARDIEQRRKLKSAGWRVFRVWESVIRRDSSGVAARVYRILSVT